jgi:hypothetical protein
VFAANPANLKKRFSDEKNMDCSNPDGDTPERVRAGSYRNAGS